MISFQMIRDFTTITKGNEAFSYNEAVTKDFHDNCAPSSKMRIELMTINVRII